MMLLAGCIQNNDKDGKDDNTPPKDTTPPWNLTISINEGANYTMDRKVDLYVSAKDDTFVSNVSFSNDGLTWSEWEPMLGPKTWNLTQGDGGKTVMFKAKDRAGNENRSKNATIILDTVVPAVISSNPVIGAKDVPFDNNTITITFSETIQRNANSCPFGLGAADNPGEMMSKNKRYIGTNKVECTFSEDLLPAVIYRVRLNNYDDITDLAGNMVKPQNWTFTTRDAKLEVITKTVFSPPGAGSTFVMGEIKNSDTFSFVNVHIDLEFFNATHKSLFKMENNFQLEKTFILIQPGEVWPFIIITADKDGLIKDADVVVGKNSEKFMRWTTKVPYTKVLPESDSGTLYTTPNVEYIVTGDVKNTGDKTTTALVVVCKFYDQSNNLVWVGTQDKASLGTGMTDAFQIKVQTSMTDPAKISKYTLKIYAES